MKRLSAVLFCLLALSSQGLWAYSFSWAHLSSSTPTTVNGTITLGSQTVGVTYTSTDLAFSQLNNVGTDWWSGGACGGLCPVYTAAGIPAPDTVDMIGIVGDSSLHTLSFSTPVNNPVLALISLGQPSVLTTYYFDSPFTIVTSGGGWWGGGSLNAVGVNGLEGIEGDG